MLFSVARRAYSLEALRRASAYAVNILSEEQESIANQFAQRIADRVDVDAVLEQALGPLATSGTRQAIARAESRAQALALLIMAPEFQRR